MFVSYRFTHVRLLVDDYPACYHFYRDVLGFQPAFDGEQSVYGEFDTGSVLLSLYKRDLMDAAIGVAHERTRGEDRVLISIQVANVDDAVRDLQAKGVQIVQAATDRPQWALRTAHFRDPDSNLIEINHDIPMGNGG